MHDTLRLCAFGVCVTATSLYMKTHCGKLSEIGPKGIPFQPPDWVFRWVWPCLYVITGVAWTKIGEKVDIPLSVVTGLCCLWLVLYACAKYKASAAACLVAIPSITLYAVVANTDPSASLLIPLGVWTTFAAYLNMYEVFTS